MEKPHPADVVRAEKQPCIFVLNLSAPETERLAGLCRRFGEVFTAADLEGIGSRLRGGEIALLIADIGLGRYASLKESFDSTTAVVLTGPEQGALNQAAEEWPSSYYIDTFVLAPADSGERGFAKAVERALEVHRVKEEAAVLRKASRQQEAKVREVYVEIQEIKGLLNANFIREVEKRVAIEAKYLWFQRERQRLEAILRSIYAADDVSSLLDLVPAIRDIVRAKSATVYIIEENEILGRYLKPLIWDNDFLTHSDFSKYIAPLDSQDFAASVARYGQPVNVADPGSDPRLTLRYTTYLKTPPRALLAVPIMHDRKVIGVVEVYDKQGEGAAPPLSFNREDQQILQGLSEHMAIAMIKLNLIQYDALTGLLRPDPFFEKVLQKVNALSQRRREEGVLALVMGDVDWFKAYNDRNGHEAGNKLLRELAHILKMSIREEDLLCRYGGEEFLFFLMGLKNDEAAAQLTERIRKAVEDHYFDNQEFQPERNLTMSFGITVLPGKEHDRPLALTKADLKRLAGEADLAMAEAKGKRRPELKFLEGAEPIQAKNRISIYRHDIDARKRAEAGSERPWVFREKRKHERYNASAVLILREETRFRVSKTINMSLEGARIISDTRLPLAKTMETILVLGDNASAFKSDVIYSEKAEGEAAFFYSGLRFREQTHKDIKGLEDYLAQFRPKASAEA